MSAPDYFRQPPEALRADRARSGEIEAQLTKLLARWIELS